MELWGHGAVQINKVDVDSKENPGRYVTKYFEKGIGQELLENFGKQAYLSSRNLKKPDEDKFYTYETIDFANSTVLYETEYMSKVYIDRQYFDNHVKYKKIRLDKSRSKSHDSNYKEKWSRCLWFRWWDF